MLQTTVLLALWLSTAACSYAMQPAMGLQGLNFLRLQSLKKATQHTKFLVQNTGLPVTEYKPDYSEFPSHYFKQPLDHFFNSTNSTFGQRYWISTRHYTPGSGGPVIVLDGGETTGEDRLPFLDTGIVEILTAATGGVGVILEHRYYGDSIPVSNFSTDNLRWLNNAQSAADSANFMANVQFPGIPEDLTAPGTPWIYYGGSYAGARAAHMRILYPDLVFGAIASSAVTHAAVDYWEYFETIRLAADPTCASHLEKSIATIDKVLAIPYLKNVLKGLFGLKDLKRDEDFASVLKWPLFAWQGKVWDPEVGSTEWEEFCEALDQKPAPFTHGYAGKKEQAGTLTLPGGLTLDLSVLNYAKFIKENVVAQYCPENMTVDECFGTFDQDEKFRDVFDMGMSRAWGFQVCTEWGYFSTSPPNQTAPRIVSRLLNLAYESRQCPLAYPRGKYFTIPSTPNVSVVNSLGDFAIAADRLAFIDGDVDPWRPATPHSQYAEDREDTILRPFKIIPRAVHHYDEYGLRNIADEPKRMRKIHGEMIAFVLEWLKDWKVEDRNAK